MFAKMKLGAKLISSYVIVALVLLAVGLLAYLAIEDMSAKTGDIVATEPLAEAASQLELLVTADHRSAIEIMAAKDRRALDRAWADHQKLVERFDVFINAFLKGGQAEGTTIAAAKDPGLRALATQADTFHNDKFQPLIKQMFEAKGKDLATRQSLSKLMRAMESSYDMVTKQAGELEDKVKQIIKVRLEQGATAKEILSTENTWADMSMEIKATIANSRIKVEEYAQDLEAGGLADLEKEYNATIAEFDGWIKALLEGGKTGEGMVVRVGDPNLRKAIMELNRLHDEAFQPAVAAMFAAQKQRAKLAERAGKLESQVEQVGGEMIAALDKVVGGAKAQMKNSFDASLSAATAARVQAVAGVLVGFVLAILFGVIISRSITRPINHTRQAVATLAKGDFTARLDERYLARKDEIGEMLGAIKDMASQLSGTVREVSMAADSLATAASQISQGNQDLSERTQQQASGIEETASALEELTGSVKQNAENSRQAFELARKTSDMAGEGGQVVKNSMDSMAEVSESSKKISEIITVVNEIAFQTNLLALNAAVEAARAGEAGRGFAVVAGEVRNLAGRSAAAAKQIQDLITDSVAKVERGNGLVEKSGRLLGEIINNVQAVADTIGEITAASQEQATGVDEINQAVAMMDQSVQQNAALVEEAASASENVAANAEELRSQMGQFRVDSGLSQARRARPAAPPALETRAPAPAKPARQIAAAKPAAPAKKAPAKPKPASKKDDFFDDEGLEGFEQF